MSNDMRWPGATYDPTGSDLCEPISTYLNCLSLNEPSADIEASLTATPQSLQIVRAGALALSKWWAVVLGTSAVASIAAFLAAEWGAAADVTKSAFLIAIAILLSAVSVSIAMIVRTDVMTRGLASTVRIQSRQNAGGQFIAVTSDQQASRRTNPAMTEAIEQAMAALAQVA